MEDVGEDPLDQEELALIPPYSSKQWGWETSVTCAGSPDPKGWGWTLNWGILAPEVPSTKVLSNPW